MWGRYISMWNKMSAISWTSMHTASNRSTALPKLWQSFFLSQMRAKLQTPAMESGDGKFCGCANGDWTCVSSFPGRCANHYTTAPWYQVYQIYSFQSSMVDGVATCCYYYSDFTLWELQLYCYKGITLLISWPAGQGGLKWEISQYIVT